MELAVDIEKIDLKGVDHFELHCKAQVGAKVHTKSAVVDPETQSSREGTSLPRLNFRFQSTIPEASLLFTFLDLNGTPDRTELGSCLVLLILPDCSSNSESEGLLPTPSQQVLVRRSQIWVPQTKQIQVALIGSKIAGTELSKYVGKVRFMVLKRTPTPQPNHPRTTGDSAKAESLKSTQASLREQMATPESTPTPAPSAGIPPRGSVQSLAEATGSEIQDILKLRRENQPLRGENEQLRTQIHENLMESRASSSISTQPLELLTKDDLLHKIRELEEELVFESQSKRSYQGRVQQLQNALIRQNEIEAQYIQLQEAHTAQQNLVLQLQSKIRKYKQCSQLCQQQEDVVTQLESLLAQQAQGRRGNADLISELTEENARLRRELQRCRESDSELVFAALREREDTIRSLEAQLSKTAGKLELHIAEGSRMQVGLEQRLIAAEKRVQTLMAEIQQNASKWAREKACYKLQLEELRNS